MTSPSRSTRPARSGASRRQRRRFSGAAFFDLDRTLLAGASGPVISQALRTVGVISGEPNPLEPLLFRLYDLFGENSPTMFVTRHASRAARGWPVESVRAAAALAAPTLADNVLPYARREIEQHHAEGRAVVLATTTPRQILEPFAELLGFDDVIATNYGHDGDTFDGRVIGEFVWGRAKARAVAAWAAEHGVELGDSSAYSDSYYDVPLLSIVGRPHAVNPDPRLAMIAVLRRWPIRHFDLPSGVPKVGWVEPQRLILNLARAELMPWVRFQVHGVRRIPESGPAIIVGNHRSYFDPIAVGHLLARRGRPARFLGKKEVFDAPVVGDVARAMGGIRVERGTGSDEPLPRHGGGARRRRHGGDDAAGDNPARLRVLQPGAQGPLGCGTACCRNRRAGDPCWALGNRTCLAAFVAVAERDHDREPAHRHDAGGQASRSGVPLGGARHRTHHGGDHVAAPARGASAPRAHR